MEQPQTAYAQAYNKREELITQWTESFDTVEELLTSQNLNRVDIAWWAHEDLMDRVGGQS